LAVHLQIYDGGGNGALNNGGGIEHFFATATWPDWREVPAAAV
jgi:hypothetical protein